MNLIIMIDLPVITKTGRLTKKIVVKPNFKQIYIYFKPLYSELQIKVILV